MSMTKIQIKKLAEELANESDNRNQEQLAQLRKEQFEDALQSAQLTPSKKKLMQNIRISLIGVDNSYQRNEWLDQAHVKHLADNWNERIFDPIKVSPHRDKSLFIVVDGDHRLEAAIARGETYIECEILQGLSENEEERLRQEAMLYTKQDVHVHKLTQQQKHNANVIIGVPENIILDELMDKYGLAYKPRKNGKVYAYTKIGQLSGFTAALSAARTGGRSHLDDIFYVLTESRWNMAPAGLSSVAVRGLDKLLKLHPTEKKELKKGLIRYFRTMMPRDVVSLGNVHYPMRDSITERWVLAVEDKMNELIGLPLEYLKDDATITRFANEGIKTVA